MIEGTVVGPTPDLHAECFGSPPPPSEAPRDFVPGPGLRRLSLAFDIDAMRAALVEVTQRHPFGGPSSEAGFGAIAVTERSDGASGELSGRYWNTPEPAAGEQATELAHEDPVDERAYDTLTPAVKGTYFEEVCRELSSHLPLGRVRLLSKAVWNCNSWHRDPEARLHIPIQTNPGALFVLGNHCTHLPADGSVYFTDTRGYHTALNGGPGQRVHLVAAVLPERA